ncbi:hypothetical protein BYT27DRAFT_7220796 [Phlegmacium glaucopus]|nr:hypothetical protein BYT27DRAFT_7220796 [Phlegmacium glaucopus]
MQTLTFLDSINFKTADFLDGLSWGDQRCTHDAKVHIERTLFLRSPALPAILERWAKPSRPPGSKKKRPKGAQTVMDDFASNHLEERLSKELKNIKPNMSSPPSEDVTKKTLIETSFERLSAVMKTKAPLLWRLLNILGKKPRQEKNTHKNSEKILILICCMLSYARSHHRCRLQKLLAIYLKFKGISAKGFDTLHAMGLTMSHKWTADTCMAEVQAKIEQYPWLISYDNINISFRVFSQRLDNQGEFGNGTAGTIYIKRDAKLLPDFDLKTYQHKKDDRLKAPAPVDQLPCGPEHITLQYLLGTVGIAEVSYEDNSRLINEWFNQLGWDTIAKRIKVSVKKIVAWVGDQLTMDRLRGLFKYCAEDLNSFQRLDFSLFVFGWLHLQMAFANSLHKQFLGTTQGRGLRQGFLLLEKKGLTKVQTKGPFHHDLKETLYHIAEAHLREDWLIVAGVEKLEELRDRTQDQLCKLAKRIVEQRASSQALNNLDAKPKIQHDEQLWQLVIDVGLMEAMLPHLLFRFIGGGNGNYAGEILDDFVRHHCWLINTTGKRDQHVPNDKAQEMNIKDIKVTYRSEGPNIKWEFSKKLHPAIHAIRNVSKHIENEFGTDTRGTKHTVPKRELDVKRLQQSYHAAGYHNFSVGHGIDRHGDKATDYTLIGGLKLGTGQVISWWKNLRSFERETTEEWEGILPGENESDESEDEMEVE